MKQRGSNIKLIGPYYTYHEQICNSALHVNYAARSLVVGNFSTCTLEVRGKHSTPVVNAANKTCTRLKTDDS